MHDAQCELQYRLQICLSIYRITEKVCNRLAIVDVYQTKNDRNNVVLRAGAETGANQGPQRVPEAVCVEGKRKSKDQVGSQ